MVLGHDEVLDRDVALKLLREQYVEDEEFIGRFRREARNAASLSHPNIVQVYDQGQDEDGTYYMAMEYVSGGTLKDLIRKRGPLEPRETARIAARVAEALEVAHERGIVHRDIKPQNVLVTPSGEVKVADFGIARAASATVVTKTHLVLGTVGYMSPEQAAGERVGPASDLYSLGVVLYEMLTGELPYEADTPVAVAMKHINAPPRHPREANPDVPESLDEIVVKLLAKSPEDRYASAGELAEDLGRVEAGMSPLAANSRAATAVQSGGQKTQQTRVAPAPGSSRNQRRGRRRLPLLVLLLALLLLFGGVAWAMLQDGSNSVAGSNGNGGAEQVKVPDVVDLKEDAARSKLSDAGFKVNVSREESSADKEGLVLRQSVSAGQSKDKGSKVGIVVGKGPSTVQAPDIPYGATADKARSELEGLGLKLGATSETSSSDIAAGGVVAQDPYPGTAVQKGSAVDITLSSGPAQTPAPAPSQSGASSSPDSSSPDSSSPGTSSSGTSSSGTSSSGASQSDPQPSKPVQEQKPQKPAEQPKPSAGGKQAKPSGSSLRKEIQKDVKKKLKEN